MSKTKKYLMLLAAIGLIATVAGGAGTFASFTAEVTQSGNTFETGSLVLSEKSNTANACFSSDGANNVNSACDAIFANDENLFNAGDGQLTGHLTLANTGSISPAALTWYAPKLGLTGLFSPSGSVCQSVGYTPDNTVDTDHVFHGSGNLCTALQLQIQETDSTFAPLTGSGCVFPSDAALCGTNFAGPATLPASGVAIGNITNTTPRYFLIKLKFPGSATDKTGVDNQYQALKSYFDLTWHIEQ